ncbi:MAG: histidine kinase dimerization/phospho-acceptor domain-containing protein, partial [Methylocystis sp.]
MIELRSLSSRLITYWLAGSFLVFVLSPALVTLPLSAILAGFHQTVPLSGWTTKRARGIVLESIRIDEHGQKYIETTNELRAHKERNPEFKFAVVDAENHYILPGSSVELGSYFTNLKFFEKIYFGFHLANDANKMLYGYLLSENSPLGKFHIITYGCYFHWDDILYQLIHIDRNRDTFLFFVLSIAMVVVAVVAIQRGLAPMRALAASVAAIDINSLNQRLSTTGQPTETLPFIDAVNRAFERVNEGVERQRRFTANSAHELRTPLTILRSRVETLDDSPAKYELNRDVRRMQTIVEQMLVLAQLKERRRSEFHVIDLNQLILAVTTDFAPIAIDHGKT